MSFPPKKLLRLPKLLILHLPVPFILNRRLRPISILNAVRKKKARVLVGPDAKVLDLVVRVTGSGYQRLFSGALAKALPGVH